MPKIKNLVSGQVFSLEPGNAFVVGRSPDADLPLRDVYCSRRQFSIQVSPDGECSLLPLSTTSVTYCEDLAIHDEVRLDRDVQIRAGKSRFQFTLGDPDLPSSLPPTVEPENRTPGGTLPERETQDRSVPPIEAPAGVQTVTGGGAGPFSSERMQESFGREPIRIVNQAVIGRDPKQADIVLPHVQVSRRHAQIVLHRDGAIVTDLDSSGGTFVNGRALNGAARINNGDRIGIGPYQFIFDHGYLASAIRQSQPQLVARELTKRVQDRSTGKAKTILDGVSVVIESGQFVCLLGPAGCGKSTLLAALSGRAPADVGSVLLNGRDLVQEFEQLKYDLALVPQRDCLHRNLTVRQALRYTAKLRLPSDTGRQELESVVHRAIDSVALTAHAETRIADLSGGQTKRTSLAMELIANPSVIFLDEVTSGLDEQSDRETMELFRQLAEAGKTLVCVTHNLSNVQHTCHRVVVLAESGSLAFVGTPEEALTYFDIDRIGDIYAKLKTQPAPQWRTQFALSDIYAERVGALLARSPYQPVSISPPSGDGRRGDWKSVIRQTMILMSRYCKLLSTDRQAIVATVGQCLLVAVLIAMVFGDVTVTDQTDPRLGMQVQASRSASLLFISAISCFWFGCNNASKEFVKDRAIYLKEFHAGLDSIAYFVSRLLPLWVISISQAMLMYAIVASWCHPPTSGFTALVMGVIAGVGVTLGLAISAMAQSEDVATVVVPMALIPQIILSEGIKPLEGISQWVAEIGVSLYWGFGLLRSDLKDDLVPLLESPPTSQFLSFLVLFGHAIVFSLLTLISLRQTGLRRVLR